MTRAAIPEDKIPLVRSLIKADTDVDKVKTAVQEFFRPDQITDPRDTEAYQQLHSRPHPRDIAAVDRKMNPAATDEDYTVDDDKHDWYSENDVYATRKAMRTIPGTGATTVTPQLGSTMIMIMATWIMMTTSMRRRSNPT